MVLALAATASAQAAEIAVASVTASSTFYTYDVNNLINGSGLTGDLHSGDYQTKWLLDSTPTGTLTFDLGGAFQLDNTQVWNYGLGCCGEDRSVKDLGVAVSTDGINFVAAGDFVLTLPSTDPFPGQTLALNNVTARFVRFSLNSNYGDTTYSGLSEVKFNGVSAVPEAETHAYALAGLGVLGALLRRRKVSPR